MVSAGRNPPSSHLSETAEAVYRARWLTPDCEQLFSPGCLHVRDGQVVRVWEGTDTDAIDLGDVAIIPGLINAHTHLEFSDLPQPLAPGAKFPDWIRSIIASRRGGTTDVREAVRQGWEECRAAGTAAVGEIATDDAGYAELVALEASGVVFREVLGLQDEQIESGLEAARLFVGWASMASSGHMTSVPATPVGTAHPTLTHGLSPHAPYSLHPDLYRGLISLAVETDVPVAMHLAETREELDLLAHHRGGLVDLLTDLGLWRAELFNDFRRPLDFLRELSRCRSALIIHGNYLDDEELDFLATQPQMSVVYCPRTHAGFGHAPHPWRKMQARGIRVVLGTDSRASNPDLSVWKELQWLHARHPDVPAQELLRMATIDAARALGLSEESRGITAGSRAMFTTLTPSQPLSRDDWNGLWGADVVARG